MNDPIWEKNLLIIGKNHIESQKKSDKKLTYSRPWEGQTSHELEISLILENTTPEKVFKFEGVIPQCGDPLHLELRCPFILDDSLYLVWGQKIFIVWSRRLRSST